MHDPVVLAELVTDELAQRRESGHDVAALGPAVAEAVRDGSPAALEEVLAALEAAPRRAGWSYEEPSELEAIAALRPPAPALPALALDEAALADRVHAAWLGRCAGCMLGKPLEGVPHPDLVAHLEATGALPLEDYVPPPRDAAEAARLNPSWPQTTRGRIHGVARDDDVDFTILALHVLETDGPGFGPADVGRHWLERFPVLRLYTAERAAYRNLVAGLGPPTTATHRNPHREWIGAQIRADLFGYVSPGDPVRAAALAHADARLSHVANGIYGALWAAALVAAAFTAPDMRAALAAALAVVPERSRLAEALREVDELHARGLDWEAACAHLHERHGALSWIHAIGNATLVAAALLWGEGSFSRTVGLAVRGGWDTDCNGATAGSAFGAMHGRAALPARWTAPLGDEVRSALFGFDGSRISELAARTVRLASEGGA